ncbi:hypothetical protein SNOG_02175 [Parastagonospora nodorum SN15]|uniref:Uncharacterized protein n=1 Tax=Phaeosphaeria nodorum (strain SN15 / ATCC MYA-4574 / FGSC 10173) TaxID=321614 RepID=Q0V1D9_PHANO|nr:hypothetical protein SNOG_02175 [Parastagonospora nodorum SN15]EAT90387.1 hypothetical protein SNOG_02175 [Parastagonospora nodorum SN15]
MTQSAQDSPAFVSSVLGRYCAPQIKQERCCFAIRARVSDPLPSAWITDETKVLEDEFPGVVRPHLHTKTALENTCIWYVLR